MRSFVISIEKAQQIHAGHSPLLDPRKEFFRSTVFLDYFLVLDAVTTAAIASV